MPDLKDGESAQVQGQPDRPSFPPHRRTNMADRMAAEVRLMYLG
jgi:hypothetical protein